MPAALTRTEQPDALRYAGLGCGTGILGLAFLKLGGKRALAIDTDPLALEAAAHNAVLNNMPALTVSNEQLEDIKGAFSLITANITAQDLSQMASQLAAKLDAGGLLIISGILERQAGQVTNSMQSQGLHLLEQNQLREWVSLLFRKE
jgi:ribosomal protein L11 methyltransferase